MAEHSRGPWHEVAGFIRNRHDHDVALMDLDRVELGFCDESQVAADASLIAASPEMLSALKLAEGHLTDELHNKHIHPIGHCLVLDVVRRVISKAEGRS